MSGFAKFCMVFRFIALGFGVLMFLCAAAFTFLPKEILETYIGADSQIDYSYARTAYLYFGGIALVASFIAFMVYIPNHKRYKKVLECKRDCGWCFEEITQRLQDGYDDQTYIRFKVVWKNPKKKRNDFRVIIYAYVASSYLHSGTVDTIQSDFKGLLDDYPALDSYSFEYVTSIRGR